MERLLRRFTLLLILLVTLSALGAPDLRGPGVAESYDFGNGADGVLTTTTTVLPSTTTNLILNAAAGATMIRVASKTGLAVGDEVLLLQVQGAGAGTYELKRVSSIGGISLTLASPLVHSYASGTAPNWAMCVRVPNYQSVSVGMGGTLTANTWNGATGGVVAFRSQGAVQVQAGGSIDVSARGFRGGRAVSTVTSPHLGQAGESSDGDGALTWQRNGGGGGGSYDNYGCCTEGAGGGGHRTAGNDGVDGQASGPGQGGGTYGSSDASTIFLGAGGGAGECNSGPVNGGAGGGIVFIFAPRVDVAGTIRATGADGGAACWGGAGAGAGGTIALMTDSVNVSSGLVLASGGVGGAGGGGTQNTAGGGGGMGRIFRGGVLAPLDTTLVATPASLTGYATWRWPIALSLVTPTGTVPVANSAATWQSTDAGVAAYDGNGKILLLSAGTATITASASGKQAQVTVSVLTPVLPVVYETIPTDLATPAADATYQVPVLILRYLPTADGQNIDVSFDPDYWWLNPQPLSTYKQTIESYEHWMKYALEERSRYHGYKDPAAPHALGYRVVGIITVYEPTPPGVVYGSSPHFPDCFAIFERFNVRQYVEDLGVKEVWLWTGGVDKGTPCYDPALHQDWKLRNCWESNMASPLTGDISNSYRDPNDLPVYARSYVVYGYNTRRTQAEAIHNHGHQFEAQVSWAAQRQDGNSNLFWHSFVGQDDAGNFTGGRCGDTHMPPNTTVDYDWYNTTLVSSDIEDWNPDHTGAQTAVNVDTWSNLVYAWPISSALPQKGETQWYVYWWQNAPGRTPIAYSNGYTTNWWRFIGDWDGAVQSGAGLHSPTPTAVEGGLAPPVARLTFDRVYPNPAPAAARISFRLPGARRVSVTVFDAQGRQVRSLGEREGRSGTNEIVWDGRSDDGPGVRPGLYFVTLRAGGEQATRRVLILH